MPNALPSLLTAHKPLLSADWCWVMNVMESAQRLIQCSELGFQHCGKACAIPYHASFPLWCDVQSVPLQLAQP